MCVFVSSWRRCKLDLVYVTEEVGTIEQVSSNQSHACCCSCPNHAGRPSCGASCWPAGRGGGMAHGLARAAPIHHPGRRDRNAWCTRLPFTRLLPPPPAQVGLYPVNALRNKALQLSQTEIVLLLDADFLPNRALSDMIHDQRMYDQLRRVTGAPPPPPWVVLLWVV